MWDISLSFDLAELISCTSGAREFLGVVITPPPFLEARKRQFDALNEVNEHGGESSVKVSLRALLISEPSRRDTPVRWYHPDGVFGL